MARNTARWGRLRRVLNDEMSQGSLPTVDVDTGYLPGDTPRYGAGANIENHPQITDYVPRRFRIIALILLGGIALAIITETVANSATAINEKLSLATPDSITSIFSDRVTAWTSTITLFVTAVYMRLIVFPLRRHRVDDTRGQYRIWKTASTLCILLSINSVAGAHGFVAQNLAHLTDLKLLANNSGWWLFPGVLLGGFFLIRIVMDVSECRSAVAAFLTASGCFLAAVVGAAGFLPSNVISWSDSITRGLPLVGNLCLLSGTLLFARFIVLDVQGLINHGHSEQEPGYVNENSEETHLAENSEGENHSVSPEPQHSERTEVETLWVDGSEPENDSFDGRDQLSKAERKRLRKQKSRKRAA